MLGLERGVVLLVGLLGVGCFTDVPSDETPCEPGAQVSCECLKGDGVQVCRMSGLGYEPCQCDDDATDGQTSTTAGTTATSTASTTTGQVSAGDSSSSSEGGADSDPTVTASTSSTTTGLDTSTTTGMVSSDVVINEIVHDPVDGEEDWFELYNLGTEAVDVTDWMISDGGNFFVFPPDTIIDVDDYLVYTRNEQGSFTWGFGDDEVIVLYDAANQPVDSADWALGEAIEPDSLGRLPNGTGPFQELTPTKGEPNE